MTASSGNPSARRERILAFFNANPRASIRQAQKALGETHSVVGRAFAFWRATRWQDRAHAQEARVKS